MPWPSSFGVSTLVLHESVKASLSSPSPVESTRSSPPPNDEFRRAGSEGRQRRSLDLDWKVLRPRFRRGRRGASARRRGSNGGQDRDGSPSAAREESSDSYALSGDRELDVASMLGSSDDTPASASQILRRSDVFQSPTIRRLHDGGGAEGSDFSTEAFRRHSEEISRSGRPQAEIRVQPPSRSHTQESLTKVGQANLVNDAAQRGRGRKRRPSQLQQSKSSLTLQELVKAGSYPLQRAAGFAGYLKNHSKRMSSLLAAESMGYFEKVSGMWVGAARHYNEPMELVPDHQMQNIDDDDDDDDNDNAVEHGNRFRAHFALPHTEKLQATYFGYLHRVLPLYGKIYISNRSFCFRSLLPGTRTKVRHQSPLI